MDIVLLFERRTLLCEVAIVDHNSMKYLRGASGPDLKSDVY